MIVHACLWLQFTWFAQGLENLESARIFEKALKFLNHGATRLCQASSLHMCARAAHAVHTWYTRV